MNIRDNRRFTLPVFAILLTALAVMDFASLRYCQAADELPANDLPLKHVADIPLPGGATRLDYESYDPERNLMFIAHLGDGEVIAFDMRESRVVGRIANVSSVHGVLVIPELSRVYASATGTNEIVAIDEA